MAGAPWKGLALDREKEELLEELREDGVSKRAAERKRNIATSRLLAQAWIFALDISYGMFGTLSSYFLTEIIFDADDDENAVKLSTYYMIVWCSCNFLMAPVGGAITDILGRRPILLIGALTDTLVFPFMAAIRTPTVVLVGAACVGTLDCTYNVCKSIIVDAVVAGSKNARGDPGYCEDLEFGGPRDWWPSRLLYRYAFADAPGDVGLALTRELSVLNIMSIFGLLVGVWLGEALALSIGVRWAFACVGAILLPTDLWLAAALPESLEDAQPARRCCGLPSRATTKSVLNPVRSIRLLCSSTRTAALVATYARPASASIRPRERGSVVGTSWGTSGCTACRRSFCTGSRTTSSSRACRSRPRTSTASSSARSSRSSS